MTDERTGRELEPRPDDAAGAVTPREPALPQPSSSARAGASPPASRPTPSD